MALNRLIGQEKRGRYNRAMADHVIHISEEEAARDFAGVLARVRAGAEVVIESDARAVAVVRPAAEEFRPRLLSESIALAKRHAQELGYEPRTDPGFASDLEEIIRSRKPWNPPPWE
jgi:antitoxin (DNA-binding transcriptional repressor) of toxin-antitoxin stability system